MCTHFWLPKRGRLFRYVVCGLCHEKRRVCWNANSAEPRSVTDALREAIDRGVVENEEITWGGKALR